MPSSDRAALVAASVLAACIVIWAVLLPVAPWLGRVDGTLALVAALADDAGAVVCHRRPERSFASAGRRWPVCARCSGIYLAAGVTLVAGLAFRARLGGAPASTWRATFGAAVVPVALTWALERTGAMAVPNLARALSGAPLGAALAAVVLANLRLPRRGQPSSSRSDPKGR
jgi:uncharacterized membrane protein